MEPALLSGVEVAFISVPMHTAARLGLVLARRLRAALPEAAIAFYGMYAGAVRQVAVRERLADALFSGEVENPVCEWLAGPGSLRAGAGGPVVLAGFERRGQPLPDRLGLPPLDRYARVRTTQGLKLAGYTEASRGCAHRCRHCPLTPVYGGRLRLAPMETALADIEHQVALGARHITFGDPDFLNAVPHSLAICRDVHRQFPDLTFDITAKVEHLVSDVSVVEELKSLGCLFVTSAFESTSEAILDRLGKGHSPENLVELVRICRDLDLPVRPTWMAFTPWTRPRDFLDMLAFIGEHQLVEAVQPVQYSLRLLLPPGSPLIREVAEDGLLSEFDDAGLTYRWRSRDPRMDRLQRRLTDVLASPELHDCGAEGSNRAAFDRVLREASSAFGARPVGEPSTAPPVFVPGLTENWFC